VAAAGAVVAGARPTQPAPLRAAAVARQRALRPLAPRRCLALAAPGVAAGAHDGYARSPGAAARGLAAGPRGVAPGRPPAGWPSAVPSAALRESPSGQSTAAAGGLKGADGGQPVQGWHRPGRGDPLGRRRAVAVTLAQRSAQAGARRVLLGLHPGPPRRALLGAEGAYRGEPRATWGATDGAGRWESIPPTPHVQGCVVSPWGWRGERTLGGLGRQRRLSQDDERTRPTRATVWQLARRRLMGRRVARSPA